MAATQQRKLLEQLIEQDRLSINDSKICRAYCVDFCIYELFENTKVMNLRECPFLHSDKHKRQYHSGPKIPIFESTFDDQLALILSMRSKRIKEGLHKIRPNVETSSPELLQLAEQVQESEKLIDLMAAEIKMLVRQGKNELAISEAKALQTLRTKYQQDLKKFNHAYENSGPNSHQHLQPCLTCGLFIASNDSDDRLAFHFTGKMHVGFVRVLEAIKSRGLNYVL